MSGPGPVIRPTYAEEPSTSPGQPALERMKATLLSEGATVSAAASSWLMANLGGAVTGRVGPALRREADSACRPVELEGIEPSSAKRSTSALRPFPRSRHFGWRTAGSGEHAKVLAAESFLDASGLSRRQWSLPTVRHCFCCRAAAAWPRVPSPVTGALYYLVELGGEGVLLIGSCVFAPF